MSELHGVLVVDKPPKLTSAAVVARVKRVLGARKVGHTGTLDPMATGVLPLCLGDATKIAGYLLAEDKAYEGELELGVETDTLDAEGTVTRERRAEAAAIDAGAIASAAGALQGAIDQVPPMYSAIKQGGKRLHELARQGKTVERKPRRVRVDEFAITRFDSGRAQFRVRCTKGTYVRSLVRDLGEALGCGAHLTALRRTRSGVFTLADAVPLDEVNESLARQRLVPPARALGHLPKLSVPSSRVGDVANGKPLRWSQLAPNEPQPKENIALLTPSGQLLAIAAFPEGKIRYARVFPSALTSGS